MQEPELNYGSTGTYSLVRPRRRREKNSGTTDYGSTGSYSFVRGGEGEGERIWAPFGTAAL
jgi:hypothetical protein